MPSIESTTTSQIVIPSRVPSARDWRPLAARASTPSITESSKDQSASEPKPDNGSEPGYRVTEAISLDALLTNTAPPALYSIEDEISRILSMLEVGSLADSIEDDSAASHAPATEPEIDHSERTQAPAIAMPLGETAIADTDTRPAPDHAVPTSGDVSPLAIPATSEDAEEAVPTRNAPTESSEVAVRLANLIAEQKTLLEEFAAATARLEETRLRHNLPEGQADDTDDLQASQDERKGPADWMRPSSRDPDFAHREPDPEPVDPISVERAIDSGLVEAGALWPVDEDQHDTRAPSDGLAQSIDAARTTLDADRTWDEAPPLVVRREDDTMRRHYASASIAERTHLSPLPGFLGGVALSGIVGIALWAVLQA